MLCEVCNRNQAEKKLNKNINGSLKTLYVCRECFNRGGEKPPQEEKKCPNCGRTLSQINATLLVGCAHCYLVFKDELQPLLRKVQQL